MEAECAKLEKEFRAAEQAQNVPMDILYRDGQEAYDDAQASADERVNAAFAAWDAKKKDVTAKKEEVEQAKAVQYYMTPTRDDFEVYAAKGAAIPGNPVVFRDQLRSGKLDRDRLAAQHMTEDELAAATLGKTAKDGVDYGVLQHLTRQEKRIYNYLLAKDEERGTSYAREYLIFMRDPLTAREGERQADLVKNSGILRPVATVGYGVVSGLDKVATNAKQNFSDTPLHASSLQYGAGYVRDDLADVGGPKIFGSNWAQIGFDLANLTGSVAPSIAASVAGGPAAGAAVTFASAGGNAYGEALAQGYDQRSARAYGVLAGASEAGLQYVLGGISSLGGKVVNSNGIQAALNNIERAVLRIPAKYAVAAAGEMTEEYLQEILTPVFRNLALGENNEFKLFTEDAAYSALLAALSVGVLEGPNIVSTDISLDRMGQTLRGQWGGDASGVTDVLIRMGLNQEQGSDAYQAAQAAKKQLGKGRALTNVALGSLYQDVMGSFRGEGNVGQRLDDDADVGTRTVQNPVEGVKSTPGKVVVKSSGISALEGPESLGKTLASSVDSLKDMDSVAQLTGQEMNDRSKKPSEQIRAFFSKIGSVFRKGFGEVSFGEYGIGGMLNHRPLNRAKMVTLEAVPSVIENGRVISDVADWKGRGYRSVVFGAPVTIGESTVYVAAVVNQNPEGKFYLSECVDSDGNYIRIENNPSDGTKSGVTAQGGITATPEKLSSIDIIPQPPGVVNLRRSLPGGIPADIPPGLHKLYLLAQEMSASPPPREIPQRPVQQSPQEILSQLAREMAMGPQAREIPQRPVQGSGWDALHRLTQEMAQDPTQDPDVGMGTPFQSAEQYSRWLQDINAQTTTLDTVDKYREAEYNNSPEYQLLRGYAKAVEQGDISPLIGFDQFAEVDKEATRSIVGKATSTGVVIESAAPHCIARIIGQVSTPHSGMRQGISIEAVLDALQNPVKIGEIKICSDGDIRQTFQGKKAVVTISLRDKRLIQTNPTR